MARDRGHELGGQLPATAKHVGGVNLSKTISLPWSALIPKKLAVAGRIDELKTTEYLCGLRYNAATDITVASLSPANEAAKAHFLALIDYFISKKRYGVLGEKGVGNVRDMYLIPVPPGTSNYPEFMLNLEDNFIPQTRTEPMLLIVFTYRNDSTVMEQFHGANWAGQQATQSPIAGTPTPSVPGGGGPSQRAPSLSAPGFSPTSPQGAFPPLGGAAPGNAELLVDSRGPRPPSQHNGTAQGAGAPAPGGPPHQTARGTEAAAEIGPLEGEALARSILGPLMDSSTVGFILPQAHRMKSQEWMLIKDIFTKEPRARDDLQCLSIAIEAASQSPPQPPPQPGGKDFAHASPRPSGPPSVAAASSSAPRASASDGSPASLDMTAVSSIFPFSFFPRSSYIVHTTSFSLSAHTRYSEAMQCNMTCGILPARDFSFFHFMRMR